MFDLFIFSYSLATAMIYDLSNPELLFILPLFKEFVALTYQAPFPRLAGRLEPIWYVS